MIHIDNELKPSDLLPGIEHLWELSAAKIQAIETTADERSGSPVFTVAGKYVAKGWTDWTRGFEYGSALLQYDATGDETFLDLGRRRTVEAMPTHVSDMGVHDHGFNIVSAYGALWRLAKEGRIPCDAGELALYELALRTSGAVQARRWTRTSEGGFIHSFNGAHSLFVDTIRTLRSLALAHDLGQVLLAEQGERVSLLVRLVQHARATAQYAVYYGEGRDIYDVPGRVAHESLFNPANGRYRSPCSQQGYSPFTTWTRGLAWAMLGFAEQLEYLERVPDEALAPMGTRDAVEGMMRRAARATCDFYIANTPTDGVPYWDTGAPGLVQLDDYLDRPADPFNDHEPVDSSAATIAAQGLLRLGSYLEKDDLTKDAQRYRQAGLTVLRTLLDAPYLATDTGHEGLVLHAVYHRPNGWDHVPAGAACPSGEAAMWGDYHMREVALYVQRLARNEPYYAFFGPVTR